MRSNAVFVGCGAILALGCSDQQCDPAVAANESFLITMAEHYRGLTTCPSAALNPQRGDTFSVTAGDEAESGGCTTRSFIADRPSFVPADYGTCRPQGGQTFVCDSGEIAGATDICRYTAEFSLVGFHMDPGAAYVAIYTTQTTRAVAADPQSPCTKQQTTCGDSYTISITQTH